MDISDIKVSSAVMHAPWNAYRASLVNVLRKKIANLKVIEDTNREGVWQTAKRSWLSAFNTNSTHHLVVQDDIEVCNGFMADLPHVISALPDKPIYLFTTRNSVLEAAQNKDSHWVRQYGALSGCGVILPKWMIKEWFEWLPTVIPDDWEPNVDDSRLALFLLSRKESAWITIPTLVEHLGASSSEIGHNNARRVSCNYLGSRRPREIDWTKGAKDAPTAGSGMSYEGYLKKCKLST